jgi:hypothetical protein
MCQMLYLHIASDVHHNPSRVFLPSWAPVAHAWRQKSGGSQFEASQGKEFEDPLSKKAITKKGWLGGPSGRAPV